MNQERAKNDTTVFPFGSRARVCAVACLSLLLVLSGCSRFMHPKAAEYLEQAKGKTGVETLTNLTSMMEATLPEARDPQAYQAGLDKLHDQFHALKDGFCDVTEEQAAHPSYVKAATIRRETRTVFHRLWKYRDDQAFRDAHLDLFATRLQELRNALQAI